jgi:hypothetical protein
MAISPETAKTATVAFFITFPCIGDGRADMARSIPRWNLALDPQISEAA